MNNPIFLVSTGRTGTKFFSKFFSTYCVDVTSYHTTRYTRLLNVIGNMRREGLISESMMKVIWKKLKLNEIQSHDLRYVECNPYYYNMMDVISCYFPRAKFIHIIRSPKSFIISHIKWERQRLQSIIANRVIPFWQPVSYLNLLKGFHNDYYQRVEFYSKVWSVKNDMVLKTIAGNGNAISIKFENVFHPVMGANVMEQLVEWLDLETKKPITAVMITKKVNITKQDNHDIWDEHCTDIMNKVCGSLMKELGYEN